MLNIRTVAVIGSGTMGAGIAEVAASHGHPVMMYDIASDAISRAIDGIRQRLASRVTRGKLTEEACGQILARLTPVTDISALTAADLVIEAASERLEVKKALFAELAEICPPQTLLTSNTSSISITAIAADIRHPERVAGLHFFNPAPVMKLVEVVSGLATSPEVADALCELALNWGKQPVRCQSTPGKKSGKGVYDWRGESPQVPWLDAVNDSFSPMRVERKRDGVTEIDDVLLIETQGETAQALALRLNCPVVVVDRIERDVAVIASAASNPHTATQKVIRYLQQQGKRVVQIADYPGLLVWRTVAMIANEALDALQKGVASEKDIDTAMRLGVNYPSGPIAWGERLGWQRLLTLLENLQRHYGEERYRPCSLLRQRALLESSYES